MRVRGTVVVLLLVVLTGCDGDPAAPSPTSAPPTLVVGTPTLDPSGIEPCPAPETEPERVEGALPAGAISVRLCPGPAPRTDLEDDWPSIQAAPDAVTLGAGHLAATLNGLPDLDLGRDEFCTQQGRPRIMAVFGYADGSSRTVTYGYGDCGVLELTDPGDFPSSGPLFREGADIFFTAYVDQLLAQRASLSPPTAAPPTPSCVPNIRPQSLVPAGRVPLATAAYCALDDRGRWHRAPIPTPLASRLSDGFAGTDPALDESSCGAPRGKVVGWSTWGDSVDLWLHDECAVAIQEPLTGGAFTPLDASILAALEALPRGRPIRQS